MGVRTFSVLSASVVSLAVSAGGAFASQTRHGKDVLGRCTEVRLAPGASCINPDWVQASESWLIAAEDEATGGTLCVYLGRWVGGRYVREGAPTPMSCNGEPVIFTHGFGGHPTVYNDTGHWATIMLAVFH
ncbi:MAG: hypothetical protein ACYDA6_05890 [Solirubrobacteraceae bacterium]